MYPAVKSSNALLIAAERKQYNRWYHLGYPESIKLFHLKIGS